MYYTFASQLRVIEQQLASAQMNAAMMNNLQNVNKVMTSVNAQMNPQQMQETMKEFQKETEKMGIQQDMMQDAMDMCTDGDTESQADEVYNQILGEVGMGVNDEMKTGTKEIVNPAAATAAPAQVSRLINSYMYVLFREMIYKQDLMHSRDSDQNHKCENKESFTHIICKDVYSYIVMNQLERFIYFSHLADA